MTIAKRVLPGWEEESFRAASREDHLWRVNWRKLGYPFVGIYCIAPDNRWPTKIGVSHNVGLRISHLQVASWRRLDVAGYVYCRDRADALAIEAKVHALLAEDGKELSGEWFDIRSEQTRELVQFAADTLGIEIRSDVPDDRVGSILDKLMRDFLGNPSISKGAKEQRDEKKGRQAQPLFASMVRAL